ncbi:MULTISPECIES: hypothetical protein [Sphingobium]|uniref:hypothetical protein n=1 Tax=Sphingobium sp. MI1205 TaxID=407020 RepID=UPI0007701AE3|nr:hypothetical protein [Sphingobium sp. MI1205]AMK20492.1 hypothetical protein K663_20678 [Sphingobium sp. MI1205]
MFLSVLYASQRILQHPIGHSFDRRSIFQERSEIFRQDLAGVSSLGLSFADLRGAALCTHLGNKRPIHRATAVDGIFYTSRFENKPCVALFERAQDAFE